MQLTEEQKQVVRKWAEEGLGLSDIQKKLSAELGVTLTYMDVRFLALDMGLQIKEKTAPPAPGQREIGKAPGRETGLEKEDAFEEETPPARGPGEGAVSVEISRVTRPGSLASGSVTFGDGSKANWWVDQFGRLALDPGKGGHKPGAGDLQAFQMELRKLLEKRGF